MEKNQTTWIAVGVTAIGSVIAYLGYNVYHNSTFPSAEANQTNNISYTEDNNTNGEVEVNAVESMKMKPPSFLESFWKSSYTQLQLDAMETD
ncbi:MAG: hypothetical protein CXT73_06585 [Methanobacteriota archaeon]|nr:MAG: hypothetical protein CXT73_06585 [Euryarchaeota archaeon]